MADAQSVFGGTLQFKIWVTRGCYFALSDRLKRKARYSVGAITILSFYVFVISMIALVFGTSLSPNTILLMSTLSIVLSVFIIIISLLENSKNYALDAESASQTAHALEDLYYKYESFLLAPVAANEDAHRHKYAEILASARTNRRAIDYHLFQLSNVGEFKLSWSRLFVAIALFLLETIAEYWVYATMMIVPLAVVIALLMGLVSKPP